MPDQGAIAISNELTEFRRDVTSLFDQLRRQVENLATTEQFDPPSLPVCEPSDAKLIPVNREPSSDDEAASMNRLKDLREKLSALVEPQNEPAPEASET